MESKKDAGRIALNDAIPIPQELSRWVKSSVQPSTAPVYIRNFTGWFTWLQEEGPEELRGLSPKELAKMQNDLNWNRELMKDEKKIIVHSILDYLNRDGLEWRTGYKRKINSSIRSFFSSLIEPGLPKLSNGEKGRLKGQPKTEKLLNIKIIKEIIDTSNTMYRAVWSSMLASGMGFNELIEFSGLGIQALRAKLANPIQRDGEDLIEIYLSSRKSNLDTEFYVYIGGSALDYLKTYLIHRDDMEVRFHSPEMRSERSRYYRKAGKEAPPLPESFPDAVFVNNTYKALNYSAAQFYWRSQLVQLKKWKSTGKKNARTGMNFHQIRAEFRTRAAKSNAKSDFSEYFMGHEIDSLGYNLISREREYRITEYLKLLPWVDIDKINIVQQSEESEAQKKKLEDSEQAILQLQEKVADLTTMVVKETIPSQAQMIKNLESAKNRALETALRTANYYIAVAEREGDTEKVAILKAERALLLPESA